MMWDGQIANPRSEQERELDLRTRLEQAVAESEKRMQRDDTIHTERLGVREALVIFIRSLMGLFGRQQKKKTNEPELFDGVPLPTHIFAQMLALRIKRHPEALWFSIDTQRNAGGAYVDSTETREYLWQHGGFRIKANFLTRIFHRDYSDEWSLSISHEDKSVSLPSLIEREVKEVTDALEWAHKHNVEKEAAKLEHDRQMKAVDAIEHMVSGSKPKPLSNDYTKCYTDYTGCTTATEYTVYAHLTKDGT